VVINIGSGSLVVMRPGGGIDALDASTGKLRWTSAEADRPLLAEGGRLIIPIGPPSRQEMFRFTRRGDTFKRDVLPEMRRAASANCTVVCSAVLQYARRKDDAAALFQRNSARHPAS